MNENLTAQLELFFRKGKTMAEISTSKPALAGQRLRLVSDSGGMADRATKQAQAMQAVRASVGSIAGAARQLEREAFILEKLDDALRQGRAVFGSAKLLQLLRMAMATEQRHADLDDNRGGAA